MFKFKIQNILTHCAYTDIHHLYSIESDKMTFIEYYILTSTFIFPFSENQYVIPFIFLNPLFLNIVSCRKLALNIEIKGTMLNISMFALSLLLFVNQFRHEAL